MLASKLVSDIVLRIKGYSDDSYVERSQILHWLGIYRDAIVKEYLDNLIKQGKQIDPYYIERETCLEIGEESTDCIDQEDERLYVTISKQPLSLEQDRGFVQLTTSENVLVHKARLETITWIKDLPYASPSKTNLVYYRHGTKIVIDGLSYKNKSSEFIAYYIPSYADQELTESSEFIIHESLLPQLLEIVEDVARRELYGPDDSENDGTDKRQVNE